jgi:hypothetical protein
MQNGIMRQNAKSHPSPDGPTVSDERSKAAFPISQPLKWMLENSLNPCNRVMRPGQDEPSD